MDSVTDFRRWMDELCHKARKQVAALTALAHVFDQEAERLLRRDQAQRLRDLKVEVMREVNHIQVMEEAESYEFNKGTFIGGVVNFALGSLAAAVSHSREHPLSAGARLAESEFARSAPFGTVAVAVGPGGVPDDIDVIPLSRLARESGRSESDTEATLRADGYLVLTPQSFSKVLDELEQKVLAGTVTLPMGTDQLSTKITRRGSQLFVKRQH